MALQAATRDRSGRSFRVHFLLPFVLLQYWFQPCLEDLFWCPSFHSTAWRGQSQLYSAGADRRFQIFPRRAVRRGAGLFSTAPGRYHRLPGGQRGMAEIARGADRARADAAWRGPKKGFSKASTHSHKATGFVVIASRRMVVRTFAWLGRRRRLAKDWERAMAFSETCLLIAAIRRALRFIARQEKPVAEF